MKPDHFYPETNEYSTNLRESPQVIRILMKIVAACALLFMTVQSLYAQDHQPIIDMHLHAYPVGHFWPPGTPNPATGVPSPETDEELFHQTLAAMDRHNIVLAVTSGYPYKVVLDWNKKDPERIIPSPYVGGSRGYWPGNRSATSSTTTLHGF